MIPVFGGYPDGFWYRATDAASAKRGLFLYGDPLPMKTSVTICDRIVPTSTRTSRLTHYLTAEMAGGMEVAYHRRPLMSSDDIAALDIAKLVSGVTLYGYYMFHGGTNPDGKLTTLQESQATGYPNDLP